VRRLAARERVGASARQLQASHVRGLHRRRLKLRLRAVFSLLLGLHEGQAHKGPKFQRGKWIASPEGMLLRSFGVTASVSKNEKPSKLHISRTALTGGLTSTSPCSRQPFMIWVAAASQCLSRSCTMPRNKCSNPEEGGGAAHSSNRTLVRISPFFNQCKYQSDADGLASLGSWVASAAPRGGRALEFDVIRIHAVLVMSRGRKAINSPLLMHVICFTFHCGYGVFCRAPQS
jgi:hypothetical protein